MVRAFYCDQPQHMPSSMIRWTGSATSCFRLSVCDEANSVSDLGGQERIRTLHRELLLQSCGVFESQRVCEFLVLGLASKNNRTRIEAIEVKVLQTEYRS